MGCEVTSDPALFGGAPVFWCGPGIRPKPKPCGTCGKPARNLCDWKAERLVRVHPAQLRVGDIYQTQGKQHLRVQVVSRFQDELYLDSHCKVTMFGITYKSGVSFLFYRTGRERVPVLRNVLCSAPCCWRHSRAVGPNTHYCQLHWAAWETNP